MLVTTKELRAALGAVGSAVSSRPGIPALTGVRIDAEPGRLTFTSTDLETSVVVHTRADVETGRETWAALVPFKPLKEAARAFKGETFALHPDGAGSLVVNAGGSLRLLPLDDFPAVERPAELVAELDAGRFRRLVESVAAACSTDEARPVLTGALLELDDVGGRLTMAATDSYRLHVGSMAGVMGDGKAIVPGRALRAVAKLIGKRGEGTVLVHGDLDNGSSVGFELALSGAPVVLVVRVIEGEFPNYRQLIPDRGAGGELHYEPAAMLEAIGNAAPYCRDTSPIRLALNGGALGISASSPDLGTYEVGPVDGADWSGEPLSVAFNPTYLGGCVAALGDAAGPVLYLRDGLKPGVVRAVGDELERVALVMPVRMPAAVPEPEPAKVEPEPEVEVEDDETDPGVAETAGPEVEVEYPSEVERAELERGAYIARGRAIEAAREPDPEPAEPEDAAREDEVAAELAADEADGAGHVVDLPPPPTFNGNGNGHGSTVDRSALVAKLREGTSTGSEEWCELADVGEAGGVRVRLVGGPDGRPRIDARRFVTSKRYNGPTKKGWAIEPGPAAVLAGLLLDAAAAAAELESV